MKDDQKFGVTIFNTTSDDVEVKRGSLGNVWVDIGRLTMFFDDTSQVAELGLAIYVAALEAERSSAA